MHDWMFEPGGEPLTLPEPQSYAPEDSSWFAATPGGEDDWLVSLPTPSSLPDIEVPPPPRPTPGQFYNPGDYGGWDGHDTSEPWVPQYPPPPQTPCELDQAMDGLAQQIEAMIKATPDWNAREYGAYILRDADGYLHIGQFMRGETVAEAIQAGRAAPSLGYQTTIPAGWSVVGAVHSHPDVGYDNAADLVNRYPSLYPGGGDYNAFDRVIGGSPHFAPAAIFAQYILGPDGLLREFNWSEGRVTVNNDTRANDRHNLSSDRRCS
jgi:hypothetical protein